MTYVFVVVVVFFFFFKQKTAYEMRISDWSSDVCSSDLGGTPLPGGRYVLRGRCAVEFHRRAGRGQDGSVAVQAPGRLGAPPPAAPHLPGGCTQGWPVPLGKFLASWAGPRETGAGLRSGDDRCPRICSVTRFHRCSAAWAFCRLTCRASSRPWTRTGSWKANC